MIYAKHEKRDITFNRQQTYDNIFGDGANVELVVRRLITSLGFKSKLLGTRYLEDAILYRYANADRIFAGMTNKAYVAVAETNHSTSTRVERAIRNAIINCHAHGALQCFNELAQAPIIDGKYAPSNGEFMCSVVNWLQLELQWNNTREQLTISQT